LVHAAANHHSDDVVRRSPCRQTGSCFGVWLWRDAQAGEMCLCSGTAKATTSLPLLSINSGFLRPVHVAAVPAPPIHYMPTLSHSVSGWRRPIHTAFIGCYANSADALFPSLPHSPLRLPIRACSETCCFAFTLPILGGACALACALCRWCSVHTMHDRGVCPRSVRRRQPSSMKADLPSFLSALKFPTCR
jgi:hypothetical protein